MPTELGTAHGTVRIDAEVDAAAAKINAFSKQSESALTSLSNAAKSLAGAFGISFGAQAVAQFTRAAVAATEVATAYERQMVAAENLAGSQGELNALLEVYDAATGGALDQATQLANVTKLMSVGFADSAGELDKFATAIRGISVAMGTNQDTVTQNLILELFTQRGARLDQLGLQYDKVRQRADELQAADSGLSDEMAYQNAVLEQANERYGELADSAAGAATGLEKAGKAAKDAQLEIGKVLSLPVDVAGAAFAMYINSQIGLLKGYEMAWQDLYAAMQRAVGVNVPTGMTQRFIESSAGRDAGRHGGGRPVDSGFSAEANQAMLDWAAERTEIERQANADILDENNSYQRQRAGMIEEYEKNLTRAAANYAKQRARAVEEYEKGVARIQRDYQAQQLRMAEDHERNLARMRADHAQRLGDLQEDLDTKISDRRAESAERLADFAEDRDDGIEKARQASADRLLDIEEDYARSRARAVRQHEDTLSEAASRLDARAVYNEQRRFAREQEEAAESHQEKVDDEQEKLDEAIKNLNEAYAEKVADEKEALQKSIDQAQIAYDKQVADANEAFAQREQDAIDSYARQAEDFETQHQQRLTDMAGDFTEEMTQRDNDQIARIGEMKIDHQENLTELDTEHGERLLQIGRHAAEERGQLDTEFEKRMTQLSGHEFDLETEAFKHQDRMLGGYQDYLDDVEKEQIRHQIRMLRLLKETPGLTPAEIKEIDDAITDLGTALGKVGDAVTHVNPRIAPVQTFPGDTGTLAGMAMLGGAGVITPPAGSGGTTVAGMAVTIASGAIVIHAAPGQSVAGMGDEFETRLLQVLKKVGGLG